MDFRFEIQDMLRSKGMANVLETNKTIFAIATIGLLVGKDNLQEIVFNSCVNDRDTFEHQIFSLISMEKETEIARDVFNFIPRSIDGKMLSNIIDIVIKFDLLHIVLELNVFDCTSSGIKEYYKSDFPLSSVSWINHLVAEIFRTHGGKSLYNSDCGTGDFVTELLEKGIAEKAIGNSYINENYIIAMIKAYFLQGAFDIRNVDFFSPALKEDEKVDMAYCSYPLMIKYEKESIIPMINSWDFSFELNKKCSSNLLWIINALQSVKPDGVVVAFVTNGVLFNGADVDIRRYLIENNYIDSIISLPTGILPFAGVSTSLIVLKKNKVENKCVRMIDATKICQKQRRYSIFTEEDIMRIISLYEGVNDSDDAFNVSYDDIIKNNYNLGIGKYIETGYTMINPCVLESITRSIFRGYQIKASEFDEISTMNEEDTEYRIINVADIKTDGVVEKNLQAVVIDDTRKFSKYCVEDGDIIITAKNTTIKTAIYREQGYKAILTGNLIAIRVNEKKIDPFYLKAFLDSDLGEALLKSIQTGTTVFSISPNSLKKLVVSLPPMEKQKEIANEYNETISEIEELLSRYNEKSAYMKKIYDVFAG